MNKDFRKNIVVQAVLLGTGLGILDALYIANGTNMYIGDIHFLNIVALLVVFWVVVSKIALLLLIIPIKLLRTKIKFQISISLSEKTQNRLTRLSRLYFVFLVIFLIWQYAFSSKHQLPYMHATGESATSEKPNIILISVDTLRADRLSTYGYTQTTKNIDAFAQKGLVFTHAYTPSDWTFPSFAAIMTGKYPTELGISVNKKPLSIIKQEDKISDTETTMAEYLQHNGWYTQAILTNPWLSSQYGFNQGFDNFFSIADQVKPFSFHQRGKKALMFRLTKRISPQAYQVLRSIFIQLVGTDENPFEIDAAEIVDDTIDWLQHSKDTGRFFLWTHFMDPHAPYDPPADYYPTFPTVSTKTARYIGREGTIDSDNVRFSTKEIAVASQLYDAEIQYLDTQLGRLFEYLQTSGLRSNSIVIFLSDHGEEFWEHGNDGHGRTFYQESIHVPLIVALPDGKSARIEQQTALIDVMESILSQVGIAIEDPTITRRANDVFGTAAQQKFIVSEGNAHGTDKKAFMWNNWKLLYDMNEQTAKLYNLASDPFEENDISQKNPSMTRDATSQLVSFLDAISAKSPQADFQTDEQLDFGY